MYPLIDLREHRFNEPNMAKRSNLSASDACAQWGEVIAVAKKHKLQFGSPAVNHCNGQGNRTKGCFQDTFEWFDDFVSAAPYIHTPLTVQTLGC